MKTSRGSLESYRDPDEIDRGEIAEGIRIRAIVSRFLRASASESIYLCK